MLKQVPLKWSAKFTANSFPLFIKQYFIKVLGKFQKFSDWEVRQEQWASLGAVSGDGFQQSWGLGWAQCQGMSTAMSQTTEGSTQESHCVTQYNQSMASACRWHAFSPCWVTYWTGMEFIPYQHKGRVSVAKLTDGRYNDKLNRATQSLAQPQVLRVSQTHCLPVNPICLPPITNTALHCLGRCNTLSCSYNTKYFSLIAPTYLAMLTVLKRPRRASHSFPVARC